LNRKGREGRKGTPSANSRNARIRHEPEKPLPIRYQGTEISMGYRIDLRLNQKVIVELKAVDRLLPIHPAQVLSYLKLSGCKLGFLINFNVLHLKEGIKRVVNGL